MTERLYYTDSTLLEFEARIVETGQYRTGYYTVLDRSAFYPTSGGQLFDTGMLGEVRINEVIESESGDVWHLSESAVGQVGDRVRGKVDYKRRLLNCQKHTAQHILSQAFYRLYNYETVSVHLGEEYAAVEFNTKQIPDTHLLEGERLALEVIEANCPVEILFVEDTEISKLPLRRPPKRSGTIRVIKIGDYECSACGGTHCRFTAEVGMLKIIGVEKMRGHTLVKYHVGRQAWADYGKRLKVTTDLSRQLSCNVNNIVDSVKKLIDDNKTLQQQIRQLQKEQLPTLIESKANDAYRCGNYNFVCDTVEGIDSKLVNKLTCIIAEQINGIAVILADNRLYVAVDTDIELHAGELVKKFTALYNLKGGGNKALAQVGGIGEPKLREIKDSFERLINAG